MSKKHAFLQFFSKIAIFACVFCTIPAWSETTCDIDYTPVTGNSIQNGTPTPTAPVEIESVGTKVGNKYAVQVAINNGGGVVDLGTLDWRKLGYYGVDFATSSLNDIIDSNPKSFTLMYKKGGQGAVLPDKSYYLGQYSYLGNKGLYIADSEKTSWTAEQFKQAMSGVMLYYQRTTDETWTAPTLKTVYLDEPLRKVGDYADVLDYKNGTITRNVGVKVLDGTESWTQGAASPTFKASLNVVDSESKDSQDMLCSHFKSIKTNVTSAVNDNQCAMFTPGSLVTYDKLVIGKYDMPNLTAWKQWLADQYAAGTPVTVYYPLATPVVEQIENWSCPVPITDIQIATTKMVDEEFAPLNTALANAISVVDNVVTQTIAQAGQIATLQNTKQTRPSDDNECPANMKCLLVTDESGTPHWYPIIEP